MNINSLVMDQYKSGCCNIDINKKQKTIGLETFLNNKFIINQKYFFVNKIVRNLDNLLFHFQKTINFIKVKITNNQICHINRLCQIFQQKFINQKKICLIFKVI